MKKRIIALLLTFVMAIGLLAGCNNATTTETTAGKEETKTPETANGETEAPTEAPTDAPEKPAYPIVDEPITIKAAVRSRDLTVPNRLLLDKMAELTGITVELVNIEKEQYNVFLTSDEWPDIFFEGFDASMLYDYGVLGGRLVDYRDHLDIMPHLSKILEEYPDVYRMCAQDDGGLYALPRVAPRGSSMTRVHYNAVFLENNNLKEPTTLDEFYNVLVACRDLNNGQAPLAVQLELGNQYLTPVLFPAFGEYGVLGRVVGEDGVVADSYASDQYREYLKYVRKLYDENLLIKEYLTTDKAAQAGLVQEGSAIFFAECATSLTADAFEEGTFRFGTLSPLVAKEGDTPRTMTTNGIQNSRNFVINADSPYVEEICKWVDVAFAQEEVAEGTGLWGMAFNYGPVGITIHIDEADGTYTKTFPDGTEGVTTSWLINNVITGMYGYEENSLSAKSNDPLGKRDYSAKVYPYCTIPAYPSVNYNEDEQSVIDQYSTELEEYKISMRNKFIMGVEDVYDDATWQNYLDMLDTYGVEEVVEAWQSAYDRYMSR